MPKINAAVFIPITLAAIFACTSALAEPSSPPHPSALRNKATNGVTKWVMTGSPSIFRPLGTCTVPAPSMSYLWTITAPEPSSGEAFNWTVFSVSTTPPASSVSALTAQWTDGELSLLGDSTTQGVVHTYRLKPKGAGFQGTLMILLNEMRQSVDSTTGLYSDKKIPAPCFLLVDVKLAPMPG